MADTCSITFNRKGDDGKVKVSRLWQDLRKEFKGNRQEAIVNYLLTLDDEFLENNAGTLKLGGEGEITIESLKEAMGKNRNMSDALAATRLNKSLEGDRFSYREALENALRFNRSDYFRRGGNALNNYQRGLMATIQREENGKYSIVIVKRNNVEEDKLAQHVQNVFMTDALVELLKNAGLNVDFLEDSQASVWFSPENGRVEEGLKYIASVLQGGESSADVAEVAGHFIVGAMRDTELVQRLIKMFSATEKDVKNGDAKLTGELMQEVIFKGGTPETNPLYREDFDISLEAAVEAAGIVVGQQLLGPINNPYASVEIDKRTWQLKFKESVHPKRLFHTVVKFAERIWNSAMKMLGMVNKYTVQEMIQEARDAADEVVYSYMSTEERNRNSNRQNFDSNSKQTYIRRSGIKHLSQKSQDCAKAYYTTVDSLKSIANAVKRLLPRSSENAQNKEIFKTLKQLLTDVRTGVDASLNIETFALSASREAVVKALGGMAELLSGPVTDLLKEVSSETEVEDMAKTMKDFASIRAVADIYTQAASLLQYLYANADKLRIDEPLKIAGTDVEMTLKEAMDVLDEKLGNSREGGLPASIVTLMRRMTANYMTQYYGEQYVTMAAARLWPWEASDEDRRYSNGRSVLIRASERTMPSREFMDSFCKSLEKDVVWFDKIISAADSSDPMVSLGYKATRQANMKADRQAEKWWYKLEELRALMKTLFGTTDCSIFYEETDEYDNFGNRLTGNLLSTDGVLFGVWEKERHAYSMQLKREFRDELERRKQEFYADPDNAHQVYYLSDMEQAALYHDFLAGKPITKKAEQELNGREPVDKWEAWHLNHSIKDKQKRMVPDPAKYGNKKQKGDKYYDLFENPDIDATVRAQRLEWYKRLLSVKAEMDGYLPRGATVNVRAPQITGRLVHRFNNFRNRGHGFGKSLIKAMCREIGDGTHIREDEAYLFGTNNEFNEIGEDPLQNTVMFEKDKRERIAFWGVNKLKDMSNLNTDLFSTLLNYGCMAATYNAMSSVVDLAEITKEVAARRTIGEPGSKKEKRGENSRAYNRYVKFLEKNVYGLSVTPPNMLASKIALKMLRTLNRLGTWLALSGSGTGGFVNAGTGMIEVVKEAMAGEYYDSAALTKAIKLYFRTFWSNVLSKGGHLRKTDAVSLYIRHFNILSENKDFYKDLRYDRGLLHISPNATSFLGGLFMLPYRAGEHFMQCYPYLAMGYSQKYFMEVEKDGVKDLEEVSLMDLYKVKEGEDIVGRYSMGDDTFDIETGKKYPDRINVTAFEKDAEGNYINPAFHSAESYEDYKVLQQLIDRIKSLQENSRRYRDSTQVRITDITKEERDVLNKYNLVESGMLLSNDDNTKFMVQTTYKKILKLKTALRNQQDTCVYTEYDESAFMDLCRNMTNKLHGIYNMEDQVELQMNWYLSLLSGMRGYIFGMITNRFMPNRFSTIQKQRVEGYIDTAAKTLWGTFADIDNMRNWKGSALGAAMSGFLPGSIVAGTNFTGGLGLFFMPMGWTVGLCAANILLSGTMFAKSGKVQKAMAASNYSEQQYRNIRRCGATYLFITGLTLLKALLSPKFKASWDDEDDEPIVNTKNPAWGVLYYFISRWLNEQEAFNNLNGIRNEANTIDWLPIGLRTLGDYAQIGALGVEEAIDRADGKPNRENTKLYYAKGKKGVYKKGDSKFTAKLMKRSFLGDLVTGWDIATGQEPRYVGRNSYVLKRGYDAWTAIDFNRHIAK